jgi:F-type H+-transporting ATPase subunit epsilon
VIRLKIFLPSRIFLKAEAAKVNAEGLDGAFCLKPRHVDFAAALPPGLLTFTQPDGRERFLAVDEGFLVKKGPEVLVSALGAVEADNLAEIRRRVEEDFENLEEHERRARGALLKMEAGLIRRFLEVEQSG